MTGYRLVTHRKAVLVFLNTLADVSDKLTFIQDLSSKNFWSKPKARFHALTIREDPYSVFAWKIMRVTQTGVRSPQNAVLA